MMVFKRLQYPTEGQKIEVKDEKLIVPDNPIIPYITGDGTGRDIMKATKRVLTAAVQKAYGGKKKIVWFQIYAGEDAQQKYGELLPDDTFKAIERFIVALKGPLTTPIGGGFRSLNVTLRQILDLYAVMRPCRYIPGIPSPVKHPEKVNMMIFREATEDVYAGIEWKQGSKEAKKAIDFLNRELKTEIPDDAGIGIKPISVFKTKRLMRKAIRHAIDNGSSSITIMHKGNIMKFTEGAFRDWCYQLAKEEFPEQTITENELFDNYGGKAPKGKIVIKDRIADSMFQQVLTRPEEYDIIITPNLNGDFIADAIAAQIGGLGVAPSGNIGDYLALFEATHGTAPKYADKDVINPSAVINSGISMLEYLGWKEAAQLCSKAMAETIRQKRVTYDLERLMEGATKVKCSEFGDAIIENMDSVK